MTRQSNVIKKNSKNIKLSVGIPVYNGSKKIREALDSVIPQLENILGETEIVISDNASNDETPNIIQEYCKRYSFIKYFRNEDNVGFDRNCDLVFKRAQGEFVWLLSSNDRIAQGGISKVMQVISEHPDVAAIFVNYKGDREINCGEDCLCDDGNVFFDLSNFKSGLVSSNVIKRSAWNSIDSAKYFDNAWVHMGVLLEVLSRSKSFLISSPYVIQIPAENVKETWVVKTNLAYTWGLNFVRVIKSMNRYGYKPETIKKGVFAVKGGNIIGIPLLKALGLKVDYKVIKESYDIYKEFPSFWLMDLPMLLIPNFFYKIAFMCVYPARRKIKRMILRIK